jgi:TonB-linked SusC/RagA family outer membrane protein
MRIKKLPIALNKKSRKMLTLKFALCAGLITLVCFPALATGIMSYKVMIQNTGVKGKIVDKSGLPLPGVSVKLKNTNIGTVSDVSGNYIINAVDNNAILVFSYLGFETQEIAVNNRTDINITLLEDLKALQEVVVIGYQTIRKKDITGSSSSVDVVNTEKLVARSMPEALQGMAPGVAVRNGGAPGQEAVVNIRGLATFGNASPLYVIDGMFADPNTTVNPNDIADIQILKDASAAAIYGSRAGNGVIIITTKKGKEGAPKISISSRYSISQVPNSYDMMNGAEYAATNSRAYTNSGIPLQPGVANYNGNIDTDWANEILQTGSVQDFNASISGGSATSSYLISAGYFKDEGTLIAREFDRKSLRINTESTKGKFKFGENLALSTSNLTSPFQGGFAEGNPWYDVWSSVPLIPVRGNNLISSNNPGGWGYGDNGNINTFSRNQVAIANITSVNSNFVKILGNAFLEYKILDGLTYKLNAGLETSFDKSKGVRRDGSWYQNQSPDLSSLSDNRSQFLSYLFEHTLNFNYNIKKHSINGVVGYTEQTTQIDNTLGNGVRLSQFGGNYFTTLNSTSGITGDRSSSGSLTRFLLNSYLGRLNYNYDDRYLATFTFRSDKDSRFSENFRTGNFPSVALAWKVSNEDFFKVDWITDLKLRGSYGVLGVNTLGAYQFTGFLNQAPSVVFGPNQQVFAGSTQARLVFENLRWEEKETTNLGIDANLFDNRFRVTIDAFRSISSDVLVGQPLPQYLGNLQGDPIVNIGSIENKGIEFELGYRPKLGGAFKWDVAANISFIRNKVLELGNLGIDIETGLPRAYISAGNTRTQVGRSIGEYYVRKTNGIFQNQAEIDAHRAQSAYAKPGDIRYVNFVNGGTTDDINEFDRVFAGSPFPKFNTGLQFNSSYKNFSLTMQLYGAFGHKLYNDVLRDLDSYGNSNYRRDINPWTTANTNTEFPRLGYQFAPNDRGINENARGDSDRWIEDGSFLRLRNLELGYSIPTKFLEKSKIGNARLYISGQNLFTITKYSGLDPDVVGADVNLQPGVDNGNYPSSRILSFGLSVGF